MGRAPCERDEGTGRKLLTASLETRTTYSEQELDALKKLARAKKLACPHICPGLDAQSLFTVLVKGTATQTDEQRRESNRIDQLIREHGPVKASLEHVNTEGDTQ